MTIPQAAAWQKSLNVIQTGVTPQIFDTWFSKIVFEQYEEPTGTVVLQVPSPYVCEYVEQNYVELLARALRTGFGPNVRLKYRVVTDKEHGLSVDRTAEPETDGTPGGTARPRSLAQQQPAQAAAETKRAANFDSQLNPQQTFDNYIEGVCNKLPRSVGESLAEHPNTPQFNPFFIYGPSGSGKTHLINAIGVRTRQLYPQKRVLYLSARTFEVQYTTASTQGKINDFINFYQTIDVLIVDDIQEWENKKGTQNTFFHIFNHLFRNNKRIILAADRPPAELQGITDRLLTRFSCGLIAELEQPNTQLCVDILNRKIRRDGLVIPPDVIEFIARNANCSVRDLQGVINSLLAYSIVYDHGIDMRLAERVIKRAVKIDEEPLTIDDIIQAVCTHFGVDTSAVASRSRKSSFVTARQVSMYLAKKHTRMPASRIGKLVGGRDHSTVIHSCSQVERRMMVDKRFADEMTSIETSLKIKNI